LCSGARHPARDVSHQQPAHAHGSHDRRASVQAVPRPGGGRHAQHRRAAGRRHLADQRVFPRPERVGARSTGARARDAECVRQRVSSGIREGRVGVADPERTGGSLMSLHRTVLACGVTFVCALLVFTLPRFAWNSIEAAGRQQVTRPDTTAQAMPPVAAAVPQEPRGLGERLTGLLGIAFILGLGVALSRNRGAISGRVVAWGVGLQLAFAILYYLGVMQLVVKAFAIVMNKVMGASGAESLNVAASIFMGQTEAPLTIRPFLPGMTQSELMTVMTAGMAHVSGSIMAAYIAFGI